MTALTLDHGLARRLATGLGWFSLGLGVAELAAPRAIARWLGMRDGEQLVRSYGLREVAAGVGLLASQNPRPWMIARTGGDAIDIATLVATFRKNNRKNANVALALGAVLGVTVLDAMCTDRLCREKVQAVRRRRQAVRDYSDRSGFKKPAHEMRGAASDFEVPRDFRIPEPLRPLQAVGSTKS
jgi:hypothetical protein